MNTLEKNKSFVRQAMHALNQPNWADLIGNFSPSPEATAAFIEQHALFRNAFANYQCTIKQMIAEGNRVVIYCTVQATHVDDFPFGELRGVPPTGKTVTWDEVSMWEMENGKPVEGSGWLLVDGVSRLQQLGYLPVAEL